MLHTENVNVRRNWELCPRGAEESRWTSMYASLNTYGDIIISRVTHELLGKPEAYQLLFDRERDVIGLRPARIGVASHAFPARTRGRHGGQRIRGHKMIREFGIYLDATRVFHRCQMDNQGVLILDLKDSRTISSKR